MHLLKTGLYDFDTHISPDTRFSGKWFSFCFASPERPYSFHRDYPDLEIWIYAKSEKSAERALRLMLASFYIIHGVNWISDFEDFLPSNKKQGIPLSNSPRLSTHGLFESAFIATKASFRLNI